MQKSLLLILFFVLLNTSNAQKIIKFEAEGNLEVPNPCECVTLSEVSNKQNPADILIGAKKCIDLKQYEKASNLIVLSGIFGMFDTYRVEDASAHQAIIVIQSNMLQNINEDDKKILIEHLKKFKTMETKELSILCETINKIGVPTYYPRYMIQHGIQAFTDRKGDGLIENFDIDKNWKLVLKTVLKLHRIDI